MDTEVFVSTDPFNFQPEDLLKNLLVHAAEIVQDDDGQWYISHCGWQVGGLYLAPLAWDDSLSYSVYEFNYDRPGQDLTHFDLTSEKPEACEQACAENATCMAWTYVDPEYQYDNPYCWLKSGVPELKKMRGRISGVK